MPLAVGYSTPTPPPTPGGGGTGRAPDPTLSDQITITWTAPDGSVWPLTQDDLPWHTQNAAVLFGAAPIGIVADPNPLFGARVRHIQPQARIITLPLRVKADDHMTFLTAWRDIVGAFTQTRRLGPGILTVSRPDGSARQIAAYYQSGAEGQAGCGWYYDDAILALYCEDPYWSDTIPTVVTRSYSASATPFLNPFMTVSTSQTLGNTVVNNPGDVEAWPMWTITGPASGLDATNNTTGQSFSLDPNATGIGHGPLLTGETVTIDTLTSSVRGPDGSIWTAALNWPGADTWGLDPGNNSVTFSASGSGAGTSVGLSFYARYEMA